MLINLAQYPEPDSIVDGIGLRTVIWFQGCKHNCPECHNPLTHSFNTVLELDVETIIQFVLKQELQAGVTISGGDPFYQPEALLELLKQLKQHSINIWVYTGFTYEYLLNTYLQHLQHIDILVDGLFLIAEKDLSLRFKGSRNQRVIDVQESLKNNNIVLSQYN